MSPSIFTKSDYRILFGYRLILRLRNRNNLFLYDSA